VDLKEETILTMMETIATYRAALADTTEELHAWESGGRVREADGSSRT